MQMKFVIGFLCSLSLLTACSNDKEIKKDELQVGGSKVFSIQPLGEPRLSVVDETGKAVAGAQIMVGLKGQVLDSDANGQLILPAIWIAAETVTVSSPGYVRASYLGLLPQSKTFVLRKNQGTQRLELSGLTTGFTIKNGDGLVDFGIVMPMLTRQDFLQFNIGLLISPENDVIEAIGQKLQVPSNVTLPKQRESYVLPVNLDKPKYRTYFHSPGPKRVYAARGQFPFKKVIGDIQGGKEFFELINHFNILGGTVLDVNVTQTSQSQDINVMEMNFTQKRMIANAPVASDELLIGASLNEINGSLYPADIKNLSANAKDQLNVGPKGDAYILSVLKRKTETKPNSKGLDRISAVAIPFTEGVTPRHLPLMDNPRVASRQVLQVQKVQPVQGVELLGTYATLSSIKSRVIDGEKVEELEVQWEVYAAKWADSLEIPVWPNEEASPAGTMRWSVALLGTTQNVGNVDLGPAVVQAVTHVTNASSDY